MPGRAPPRSHLGGWEQGASHAARDGAARRGAARAGGGTSPGMLGTALVGRAPPGEAVGAGAAGAAALCKRARSRKQTRCQDDRRWERLVPAGCDGQGCPRHPGDSEPLVTVPRHQGPAHGASPHHSSARPPGVLGRVAWVMGEEVQKPRALPGPAGVQLTRTSSYGSNLHSRNVPGGSLPGGPALPGH